MHKEKESFWRSWFSFGSSYSDSDTDSDDEKTNKNKKINKNNSNIRPHGHGHDNVTMSTRKSSACVYSNFNVPVADGNKADKISKTQNRPASIRTLR